MPDTYKIGGLLGISYYSDVNQAIECSKSTGRKILMVFTGYNSSAIPGAELQILRATNVRQLINDQFVLVILFVDDKTPLEVADSMILDGDIVYLKTEGSRNSAILQSRFSTNSSPFYVVADTSLNAITPALGYVKDDSIQFEEMLRASLGM